MRNIGPHRTTCGFTLIELLLVVAILAAMAGLVIPMFSESQENTTHQIADVTLSNIREALNGAATKPGYLSDMKYVPGYSLVDDGSSSTVDFHLGHLVDRALFESSAFAFNTETRRGWRGPYVQNELIVQNINELRRGQFPDPTDKRTAADTTFGSRGFNNTTYGTVGDRAIGDHWGNPIVVQVPSASATLPTTELRLRFARLVSAGPNGVLETPLNPLAGMVVVSGAVNTAARGDDIILFIQRTDLYEATYDIP